ncbi:MAG: DUF1178 family protein [Sphingomonadales bacterium]|nr:MAG: DUF1178 family protein [Sphingomonadales bacterium]
MIVFDLRCAQDHVFEAWFGSSAAYEEQNAGGLVVCPICGNGDVAKAVMAPNVAAKGNQGPAIPAKVVKAAMAALAAAQNRALENSTWVGTAFADTARSMHLGEAPVTQIHGQATADEAKALIDEGVPVAPLPLPVVPPETCN